MKLIRTALVLAALLSTAACSADAETVPAAKVKQAFQAHFPNSQVVSVNKTPVAGIYEVVMAGRQIVYTDAKADYVFVDANLLDVKKHKSLTDERMEALSTVDWNSLPFDIALKEVRGNGSRKLAVFSDPDCPYCHQLEKESLSQLDNVTIYTFLYPLTQLHPDALHKAKEIWCSSDKLGSWTGWMREGKALPANDQCDTAALERIQQLGEKLQINGTPAMVFPNGRLVAGAMPKEQVEALLGQK